MKNLFKYSVAFTIVAFTFLQYPVYAIGKCLTGNCDNGKGIMLLPYGKYFGEFKEGKFSGQGTLELKDGSKYIGEFKDGNMHGTGKEILHTTDEKDSFFEYVGEYSKNLRSGKGTLTYPNGDKYIGDFKNGKFNGKGSFNYANGGKYVGDFKSGEFNGKGTLTNFIGDTYIGEFKDGYKHGTGKETILSLDNKTISIEYVGEFVQDMRSGKGVLTDAEGYKYKKKKKNGSFEGKGTLIYSNGDKYIGDFKEGYLHGKGTMIYSSGKSKTGLWEKDIFIK